MAHQNLPTHVGIIMDGNGRWAAERMLPRNAGHRAGADTLYKITEYAMKIGIPHITVFAFSTENFKRPKEEVDGILDIMRKYLKDQKKRKNAGLRLRFLGDISALPQDIQDDILLMEDRTKKYDKITFNIAFNYGGRQDILQAAKKLARFYKEDPTLDVEDITEDDFSQLLYTKEQPELDLLIRTSGEQRISNFLIWQSAYAELIFSPTLWPDFTTHSFDEALEIYASRHRRMGGL